MNIRSSLLLSALIAASLSTLWAAPPTDPKAKATYDHDKDWLSKFPPSFVATNIRGEGMQYAERRQAALDLVRQQRDFGVVSELMQAIKENSFLSDQVCDLLGEWKSRRALPLLTQVAADPKRDKTVRDHARAAAAAITNAPIDRPPVY